uniref:DELTA-pseudomyrmecitoxin-Pp1a subunit B n=1 Tax=Pseudomyrmex penetrator TaxID=621823 RepID=PP1AB_PSEPY|nr:RecName: Full=DELTA-pseudomyrmecitoxin-Pp1a subunit B; Short=DELTA-PSDTX-Pp1a subunit B [Pseudomyrmex penetrator]
IDPLTILKILKGGLKSICKHRKYLDKACASIGQ